MALPICCSGVNQQYNSSSGTCSCISPFGLDSNGNCTVSCTFPNSTYTNGTYCGCNTGYTLTSGMNNCDNPSNDTINTTYLPQLTQLASQLNSLTISMPPSSSTKGSVTQSSAGATVTLNAIAGTINLAPTPVTSGNCATFTFSNSYITSNSVIILSRSNPWFTATVDNVTAGSCTIWICDYFVNNYGATGSITFLISTPSSPSTVTQQSPNASVTLNSQQGIIVMANTSVVSRTTAVVTLNNSYIADNSVILLTIESGTQWFNHTVASITAG